MYLSFSNIVALSLETENYLVFPRSTHQFIEHNACICQCEDQVSVESKPEWDWEGEEGDN